MPKKSGNKVVMKKKPTDLWNHIVTITMVFNHMDIVLPYDLAKYISNLANPPLPYLLSIGPKRNAPSAFTASGTKRALRGLRHTKIYYPLVVWDVWSFSARVHEIPNFRDGIFRYPITSAQILKKLVGPDWTHNEINSLYK